MASLSNNEETVIVEAFEWFVLVLFCQMNQGRTKGEFWSTGN